MDEEIKIPGHAELIGAYLAFQSFGHDLRNKLTAVLMQISLIEGANEQEKMNHIYRCKTAIGEITKKLEEMGV